MQTVFHTIKNDEVDIAAWRSIYANDGLDDATIAGYIFMSKTLCVYRGLYGPPTIQPGTAESLGLPTISPVLVMECIIS